MTHTYDEPLSSFAFNMMNLRPCDKARFSIAISTTGVDFEAQMAIKLLGASQIWTNPFGTLPNMAIVFPLGLGKALH